jgi:hypothetical protein
VDEVLLLEISDVYFLPFFISFSAHLQQRYFPFAMVGKTKSFSLILLSQYLHLSKPYQPFYA